MGREEGAAFYERTIRISYTGFSRTRISCALHYAPRAFLCPDAYKIRTSTVYAIAIESDAIGDPSKDD